jgi:PAS domain S-box-containing protein
MRNHVICGSPGPIEWGIRVAQSNGGGDNDGTDLAGMGAVPLAAAMPRLNGPLASGDLDRALERAGDGAFVIGGDGCIVLWNRAAQKILGYSARDVLGKPCCEIFAGRDDRDNRLCHQGCHVTTLVKLGESVQNFDMQTRSKAGERVWINISILALPNDQPGGGATVHLFRDVTAVRELRDLVHERVMASAPPSPGPGIDETLTRREVEILKLMGTGLNTRGAADRLHVSCATVRNHVQNIFGKLGVHSRLEAVAFATRRRWL